jgi:hypothetical protein
MWFSIFAVAGFILFSFLKGVRNIKKEVSQAGGMRVKYAILIKLLLEGDSRTKIYNETSTSIILGLVVMGGYSRFEIQQAFGVIVVKWISESNIFGVFKLEWKLDENMYQEKMYEIICNDIAKINQQLP